MALTPSSNPIGRDVATPMSVALAPGGRAPNNIAKCKVNAISAPTQTLNRVYNLTDKIFLLDSGLPIFRPFFFAHFDYISHLG